MFIPLNIRHRFMLNRIKFNSCKCTLLNKNKEEKTEINQSNKIIFKNKFKKEKRNQKFKKKLKLKNQILIDWKCVSDQRRFASFLYLRCNSKSIQKITQIFGWSSVFILSVSCHFRIFHWLHAIQYLLRLT